ncbi:MAG: hypothetical protein ACPG8W_14455 [Candidatus Promineifilaceae bacterium]
MLRGLFSPRLSQTDKLSVQHQNVAWTASPRLNQTDKLSVQHHNVARTV